MNSSPANRRSGAPCCCETAAVSRREFFTSASSGLGAAALLSLLQSDSSKSAESVTVDQGKRPHHSARAKRCIFIFLAGGTSQVELFDPKPELMARTGEHLPDSFFKNERFSF